MFLNFPGHRRHFSAKMAVIFLFCTILLAACGDNTATTAPATTAAATTSAATTAAAGATTAAAAHCRRCDDCRRGRHG